MLKNSRGVSLLQVILLIVLFAVFYTIIQQLISSHRGKLARLDLKNSQTQIEEMISASLMKSVAALAFTNSKCELSASKNPDYLKFPQNPLFCLCFNKHQCLSTPPEGLPVAIYRQSMQDSQFPIAGGSTRFCDLGSLFSSNDSCRERAQKGLYLEWFRCQMDRLLLPAGELNNCKRDTHAAYQQTEVKGLFSGGKFTDEYFKETFGKAPGALPVAFAAKFTPTRDTRQNIRNFYSGILNNTAITGTPIVLPQQIARYSKKNEPCFRDKYPDTQAGNLQYIKDCPFAADARFKVSCNNEKAGCVFAKRPSWVELCYTVYYDVEDSSRVSFSPESRVGVEKCMTLKAIMETADAPKSSTGQDADESAGAENTESQAEVSASSTSEGSSSSKTPSSKNRLSLGEGHSCAINRNGALFCWGKNESGQLGIGSTENRNSPQLVLETDTDFVSAGVKHTCAIHRGALKCWGKNDQGQLGLAKTTGYENAPQNVSNLQGDIYMVSSGVDHTCAIKEDSLFCWGANGSGQLGDGGRVRSLTPVQVTGITGKITAVTAGNLHTCAMTEEGGLWCWGENTDGQLGDGSLFARTVPTLILSSGVNAVRAGLNYTCALISGAINCWGQNNKGQLGDGTFTRRNAPTFVPGLSSGQIASLASGTQHACAVVGGAVKCWGFNDSGQLGNDTSTDSNAPVQAIGLESGAIEVAAGGVHTCAVTDNKLLCWGNNQGGSLGDNTYISSLDRPVMSPVPVPGKVSAVAAGANHTCVIMEDKTVRCWGRNTKGQLGNGSTTDASDPRNPNTRASGITDATAITAGANHTCVILEDKTMRCWGDNESGQIGDGTCGSCVGMPSYNNRGCPENNCFTPPNGRGCTKTCARSNICSSPDPAPSFAICGRCEQCDYHGCQPYIGTACSAPDGTKNTPVSVFKTYGVPMQSAVSIAAGSQHTCAVALPHASPLPASGNTVYCWGKNDSAQLGTGNTPTEIVISSFPVRAWQTAEMNYPHYVSNIISVFSGKNSTCFISQDNKLKCWGSNTNKQLGPSSAIGDPLLFPGSLGELASYATAGSIGLTTCAYITGQGGASFTQNTVNCFGNNYFGQAGRPKSLQPSDYSPSGAATPMHIPGGANMMSPTPGSISVGNYHACAIHAGSLYCWGNNHYGQLGNGRATDSSVPIAVLENSLMMTGVILVTAGGDADLSDVDYRNGRQPTSGHTCAIKTDGTLWCCGNNTYGQLGFPASERSSMKTVSFNL